MRFKNELGNEIEVSIMPESAAGVSYANITISGPDSGITNRITRAEAEALATELQEYLKR